jgi:hypothetical protein
MKTNILPEDTDERGLLPKYLARASVSFSDDYLIPERRRMSRVEVRKIPGISLRLLPR